MNRLMSYWLSNVDLFSGPLATLSCAGLRQLARDLIESRTAEQMS
jgi:hypothetical protein